MLNKKTILKLKEYLKRNPSLTSEKKRYILNVLKSVKEGYAARGTTDITNADNLNVNEDGITTSTNEEPNPISKEFETKGDIDNYVRLNRGIEILPKEAESIINFRKSKPIKQDKFKIEYSTTDAFGKNTKTIIKKNKEGNGFVWVAVTEVDSGNESPPSNEPSNNSEEGLPGLNEQDNITSDDTLKVTKTITFNDEIHGANVLADFLNRLDI